VPIKRDSDRKGEASGLRIRGGRIFDPPSGRRGETGDVCVLDGRIVKTLPATAPVLEARDLVVMAGGVEVHTHIAGPAVSAARLLCPEDGGRCLPTLSEAGRRYARLGYTTVMEAAVAPLGARAAHADLDAVPIVDKGIFVLLGDDAIALDLVREGRLEDLKEYVSWMIEATHAWAVKAVNPGGVEAWKCGAHAPREEAGASGATAGRPAPPFVPAEVDLDAATLGPGLTPRRIVTSLAAAVRDIGLPHPLHLHMNGLGLPGNAELSLKTMEALRDLPAHFTHVQFHAYGGRTMQGLRSRAADLAAWFNDHPRATLDVGQVMFGPAIGVSADAPAIYRLHRATRHKWLNLDIEGQTGCGVVPLTYRESNFVSALQWAIGLEVFLLVRDPWRVFLTTDHPNAGTFSTYPAVIRLLMDRAFREEALARVHPKVKERSSLAGLSREYSLEEIAILTRAGPARALGLERKGHLAPGADADVVLYNPSADVEAMFTTPVAVVKGGVIVARDGEIVQETRGRTLRAAPPRTPGRPALERMIRDRFEAVTTLPSEDSSLPEAPPEGAEAVPAPAR
jgi:formylmethanofuran dehydrogenase subunit A